MNLAILTGPYIIANVYPKVADIAGIMGAFASLLVVYFLPVCTYLKYKYSSIHNPELAKLVQRATVTNVSTPITSPKGSEPGSFSDNSM